MHAFTVRGQASPQVLKATQHELVGRIIILGMVNSVPSGLCFLKQRRFRESAALSSATST